MERKNTILLTVIAVATLLVAVVGATFAYFTATTTTGGTGTGAGATGTTANVAGATLNLEPLSPVSYLEYPGGFAYAGASAEAVKASDTNDTNNYKLSFKVDYKVVNQTGTAVTWTLYRSTSAITNSRSCELETKTNAQDNTIPAGETRYAYSCTGTANNYGTQIATGTVTTDTDTGSITTNEELFTNSTNGATKYYYYLVVDYPNEGDQSTSDQGKTISAQITGVSGLNAVVVNNAS